jgi:cytochrome P450
MKWEQAAHRKVSVDVTRDVSGMVLEVMLISIFGAADYEQVAPHFNILSEESARNLEFAKAFRSLEKIILKLAAQRRKEKIAATDILGMLMEARDHKSGRAMSDRQLVNEIKTLIVAGHETTTSTLSWTWYLLSQHPEVEEKLSSELSNLLSDFPKLDDLPKFLYTRRVIDETLRLYPAGWLLTRKALKDDQLGDYFVPAGTEIYVSPYFIQRHPDLWQDPDRFNPDRFGYDSSQDRHPLAMLPFSAGPRNCIGEVFARVEMQIHLMTIASQLRLRLSETNLPELDIGVNLRSKHDFIMNPELKASENR